MPLTTSLHVLAVSPGTRLSGIAAVLGPDHLRRFEVTGHTGSVRAAAEEFRPRFEKALREERPDLVALEQLEGRRNTRRARAIARIVRETVAKEGVRLVTTALGEARLAVTGGLRPRRILSHRALAARFPQVKDFTRQPEWSRWYGHADQYWERAFAALAIATAVAVQDRDVQNAPVSAAPIA